MASSRTRSQGAFGADPKHARDGADAHTSQKSTHATSSTGPGSFSEHMSLTDSRLDALAACLLADGDTKREEGEERSPENMNLPGQPIEEDLDALIEELETAAAGSADVLPPRGQGCSLAATPPGDNDESLERILRAPRRADEDADDLFEEGGQPSLTRLACLRRGASASGQAPAAARANFTDFTGMLPVDSSSSSTSFASRRSADFERAVEEVRMREPSRGTADLLHQPLPVLPHGIPPRIPRMDFREVGLLAADVADDDASSDEGGRSIGSVGSERTFASRSTFASLRSYESSGRGSTTSSRTGRLSAALASAASSAARVARGIRGASSRG